MTEYQYMDIITDLLEHGERRVTRNAVVYSLFGYVLHYDLSEGFPLLTTKRMWFNGIKSELAWFLRGSTDVKQLHEHNNHIWDINTEDRDYDAGPIYGFQWRHYGAEYKDCNTDYSGQGVDQIAKLINEIKENPTSRRFILNAWNPVDQSNMSLPPCHVMYQFYVKDGSLSCQMYQRSADVFLGLPFNIASSALLTHLIAHETDLNVGKLRIILGDAHLYEEHIGAASIQLNRVPYDMPVLKIEREKDCLRDVKMDEITIEHYRHHGLLRAKLF